MNLTALCTGLSLQSHLYVRMCGKCRQLTSSLSSSGLLAITGE